MRCFNSLLITIVLVIFVFLNMQASRASGIPTHVPMEVIFDILSIRDLRGDIMVLEISTSSLANKLHLSTVVFLESPYYRKTTDSNGYSLRYEPIIKKYVRGPNTDAFFFFNVATLVFSANDMVVCVPNEYHGTSHKGTRGYSMILYKAHLSDWMQKERQHGFLRLLRSHGTSIWDLPLIDANFRRRTLIWDSEEIWCSVLNFIEKFSRMPDEKSYFQKNLSGWKLHSYYGNCHDW